MKGLAPGSASSVIGGGGCTLSDHYKAGDALQKIRQRGWDYVFLQEHSPTHILDPEKCVNAVRDFDIVVWARGAHSLLLMAWERSDSVNAEVATGNLAAAYLRVSSELDIPFA